MPAISRRALGAIGARYAAPAAPSGYVGPLDVIPGALGFWGLRAASAAAAGAVNAVRLIRSGGSGGSGADEQDIGTDATTGALDFTGTFFTGTGYTYKVVTLYNQVGSGPPGHLAPASVPGGRPIFLREGWDGKPVMEFTGSPATDLNTPSSGASTYNHPLLFTVVAMRPSTVGGGSAIQTTPLVDGWQTQISFGSARNAINMFHGNTGNTIGMDGADNALHVIAAMFNSTSSTFRVDDRVLNPATDMASVIPYSYYGPMLNNSGLGSNICTITECGFWQGTDHAAVLAALNANTTAFWVTGTRAQWDQTTQPGGPYGLHFYITNDGRAVAMINSGYTGAGMGLHYNIHTIGTVTTNQKVYVEHAVTTDAGTTEFAFGFCTAAAGSPPGDPYDTNTPSINAVIKSDGVFLCQDSANHNASCIASWGAGDRVGIAFDSQAGKMWFRKNGGSWNSVIGGSQDPAAGTGGVAIPFAGPYYGYFGAYEPLLNDKITSNFATATWVDAAPTGYTQLARTA